ncbi:MAG TPA: TolC family protein [Gemmatimonadaceae bacterium]
MFSKLAILLAAPAVLVAQQTSETYRPISLADAIKLSKENYVSIVTSSNAIRTASNSVRAARGAYYPTLSFSAGQSKSAGERLNNNTNEITSFASDWSYNTGLNASLTLYDGGGLRADLRKARADVASAEANQGSTQATLIYNVKQAYNSVLAANEQEAAARASLEVAEQNLRITVARVNAGAANVADSLQQVVNVGNARISILSAQQQFRVASGNLSRFVSASYLVTALPGDTAEASHPPIDSAAVMSLALDGPNIRALQSQLNANQATRSAARAAYLPTITASAGLSGSGTQNLYGTGVGAKPYPYSRSFSLRASYPIFNGFVRENQVAAAEISMDNTLANLRDAKLANQQQIITQVGVIRNAEEKLRLYQLSVRAAEEALRVNQQRYAAGVGTLIDVLTSQSSLVSARFNLIGARLEYRNARAQIEQVIGRDLP